LLKEQRGQQKLELKHLNVKQGYGLDAADADKKANSNQPINIIITADPRDEQAAKYIGSGDTVGGGQESRALLSPPIEGVSLPAEDHSSGGRNGKR